jgi:hypothetical protein
MIAESALLAPEADRRRFDGFLQTDHLELRFDIRIERETPTDPESKERAAPFAPSHAI